MNAARPAPGALLARLGDIPDCCAIVREFSEGDVHFALILTRRGDVVAAFENHCPHAGYPLQHANGRILVQERRFMVCAAHGASFTLERGACVGGPCDGEGLTPIEIDIVGDEIVMRRA